MEYSPEEAYRADPELSKMVDYFRAAHETKEERKERLAKEAAEAKAKQEQEKKQQEQKQNDYDNDQASAIDTLASALALETITQLVSSLQNSNENKEKEDNEEKVTQKPKITKNESEKENAISEQSPSFEENQKTQSEQQNTAGESKMKFCQNCGEQLQPGTKFCPNCGTPTGQVANAEANANQNANNASVRKQEFVGTIRKCPSCGAEVPAFSLICPSCSHELNDAKISNSLKEFQEGLVKYEGKQERDFVASFPIPNTREELGNFLVLIHSILITDFQNGADKERIVSFISKLKEIQNKISMMLPESDLLRKQAKEYLDEVNEKLVSYDKLLVTTKKERKKRKNLEYKINHPVKYVFKKILFIFLLIAVVFGVGIGGLYISSEIYDAKNDAKVKQRIADFKETTKVFKKENIVITSYYLDYYEIMDDADLTLSDKAEFYTLNVKIRCKKSVADELNNKVKKIASEQGVTKWSGQLLTNGSGEDSPGWWFAPETEKLVNMKAGETKILSIKNRSLSDKDNDYLNSFIKFIEDPDRDKLYLYFGSHKAYYTSGTLRRYVYLDHIDLYDNK